MQIYRVSNQHFMQRPLKAFENQIKTMSSQILNQANKMSDITVQKQQLGGQGHQHMEKE